MALPSTMHRVDLNIANSDSHYYAHHLLKVAQHPSETPLRMMIRILAFCLHASESLEFGKGLSEDDEPALWQKSLVGDIELWIDVGQPDEKRLRKACGRSENVVVYCYSGNSADMWWKSISSATQRFENLSVVNLAAEQLDELTELVSRSMALQCTVDTGTLWLSNDEKTIEITPQILKNVDQ